MLWVWHGFWRLSNARPQGMNGYLRIPLSEVEAYCRLHGFDFGQRTEFLFYVERLDDEFMKHVEKLREEEEKKRTTQNKTKTGRKPPRR